MVASRPGASSIPSLSAAVIAVVLAAACGKGKDQADPPSSPAAERPAARPVADRTPSGLAATATGPARTAKAEAWRADLAFLARELPSRHKNLYFALSEADFAAAVADLDRAIPGLSDPQITLALARLVARIGDGHTVLSLLPGNTHYRLLPLRLYWFADGLYVTEVAADHGWARGRKLVGIGEVDLEDAVAAVDLLISHDNPAGLLANDPGYLIVAEVLAGLGLSPSADRVSFRLADPGGAAGTLELSPVDDGKQVDWLRSTEDEARLPFYRQKRSRPYWNRYDSATRTLYLAYNACFDGADMTFAELVAGTFGFIEKNPVDRLVVDLRNNTGGNSALLAPLVTAIKAHPKINRRGGLYVIVGRATYSSALLNALELADQTAAVVAGEPTSGKPNHYGEVERFTLPSSGLQVSYSTNYFTRVDPDIPSLIPELAVAVTAADYFAHRDPVLSAVIAHSRAALAAKAP